MLGVLSANVVAERKGGSLSFERSKRCSSSTKGVRQGPRVTTGRRQPWVDIGQWSGRIFFFSFNNLLLF